MPYLKAKHLTNNSNTFNEISDKNNRKLIYAAEKLRFQSELDLEDYIEESFEQIFPELNLIKRQFCIKMQRCDLLCCHKISKQPVIIELKNEEDRGIVSQLIRYRKAILIEQPFKDKIDYSLPVKLIAIAPIFHEDNYSDYHLIDMVCQSGLKLIYIYVKPHKVLSIHFTCSCIYLKA
ncbi:hypothetical protein [Nostoc sp. FACHB-110]|uniref:hypothetical protein n=1 Tax=Nostoc sp. FACHB-110 TaxID=2692834 RepID=UPI0018EFAA5A|nr:hypothetical protein [Nostoc sp. FACHB-110]